MREDKTRTPNGPHSVSTFISRSQLNFPCINFCEVVMVASHQYHSLLVSEIKVTVRTPCIVACE